MGKPLCKLTLNVFVCMSLCRNIIQIDRSVPLLASQRIEMRNSNLIYAYSTTSKIAKFYHFSFILFQHI